MHRGAFSLLSILFALISGALFLTALPVNVPLWIGITVLVVGIAIGAASEVASWFCLGLAFCVLPAFGPGVLSLFTAGIVSGVGFGGFYDILPRTQLLQARVLLFLAFITILLPLIAGCLATLQLDYDRLLLSSILDWGGIQGVLQYYRGSYVTWHRAMLTVAGMILTATMFFTLSPIDDGEKKFRPLAAGLGFGVLFALLCLALQRGGGADLFPLNYGAFWRMTGRYSAGFSDPNAFGVMVMMMLPVFYYRTKLKGSASTYVGALGLLACISLFSGSRTFVLGMLVWLVLSAYRLVLTARRKDIKVVFCIAFATALFSVVLLGYPRLNESMQRSTQLPTVRRILQTINWNTTREMFYSRAVYTQTAIEVWRTSPILGVGLERFMVLQLDAQRRLGIDLKGWRDNANSFYLQILTEEGILGIVLVFVAFLLILYLYLAAGEGPTGVLFELGTTVSTMMAVVLFTGPHFAFEEVRYLFFILLGLGCSRLIVIPREHVRLIAVSVFVLALLYPTFFGIGLQKIIRTDTANGFYPPEISDGQAIRWSSGMAALTLCQPFPSALAVRALNPDLKNEAVGVRLSIPEQGEEATRKVELTDSAWHDIPLAILSPRDRVSVRLNVNRLWSPLAMNKGNDPRWLGVMVRWPKEVCDVTADR